MTVLCTYMALPSLNESTFIINLLSTRVEKVTSQWEILILLCSFAQVTLGTLETG